MAFSTCCHAHTNYPDINLCPDCLEYCDWIEEIETTQNDKDNTNNNTLGTD